MGVKLWKSVNREVHFSLAQNMWKTAHFLSQPDVTSTRVLYIPRIIKNMHAKSFQNTSETKIAIYYA